MWKKLKSIDYRHLICAVLVLGTLVLGLFVYEYPVIRFCESVRDFGRSIAFSFSRAFGFEVELEQTVNQFSAVDLWQEIQFDMELFIEKLQAVWSEIFVWEHFAVYLLFLFFWFVQILYWVTIGLIVLLLGSIPLILTWDDVNNDYNKDTKALVIYKRAIFRPFRAVKAWCGDFLSFFYNSRWWPFFVALWLFNFGVYSVILSFVAYYFWLLVNIDFSTLGVQLLKLLADVLLMLNTLPAVVWIAVGIYLLDRLYQSYALAFLRARVQRLMDWMAGLPMIIFLTGLPRSGKTTFLTMLSLLFSRLFRRKALEFMENNAMKFPRFPWINLELELRRAVEHHEVWNLATIRAWVALKKQRFCKNPTPDRIFGYDFENELCIYNDHLAVIDIWQAVENYAQEFLIYWLQTSLLVGNYAIREDFVFADEGNFPLLDDDFFSRAAEEIDDISTYSHILDYDMLRLGVKMVQDNVRTGALEFGIVQISEIDKDRKNSDQLREVKLKDEECNQKNDLLEESLSIAGHAAMIENFCFFRVVSDAQRPTSWSAKGRELSTLLHVMPKEGTHNALPFFWLYGGLIGRFLAFYRGFWENARYKWGNNCLVKWLLDGLASILFTFHLRRVNDYGFYRQSVELESGSMDGVREPFQIDAPHKVIYSKRFATDCLRSISATQAARCPVGLNDLPAYKDIRPSFEELSEQNSHFYNQMFRVFYIEVEKEEV